MTAAAIAMQLHENQISKKSEAIFLMGASHLQCRHLYFWSNAWKDYVWKHCIKFKPLRRRLTKLDHSYEVFNDVFILLFVTVTSATLYRFKRFYFDYIILPVMLFLVLYSSHTSTFISALSYLTAHKCLLVKVADRELLVKNTNGQTTSGRCPAASAGHVWTNKQNEDRREDFEKSRTCRRGTTRTFFGSMKLL